MPYIRVDVDVRTDPRWHDASGVVRAQAKALYLDAISYSGELLTDGHVPNTVMAGLAAELGIERPTKVMRFLVDSQHLAVTKRGYFVNEWASFHDSRQQVQKRRSDAAARKRASRAQQQLPLSPGMSHRDVTPGSQRDIERDSRGRARTQEVEPEEDPKAVDVHEPEPSLDPDDDPEPSLDDDHHPASVPASNGTAQGHTFKAPDLLRDF